MLLAEVIVYVAFAYLAVGAVFALWFVAFGIGRFDDAASGSGIGFRFIIFFGAAALWVVLAAKLAKRRNDDA